MIITYTGVAAEVTPDPRDEDIVVVEVAGDLVGHLVRRTDGRWGIVSRRTLPWPLRERLRLSEGFETQELAVNVLVSLNPQREE